MKLLVLLISLIHALIVWAGQTPTPIVLWHGMGDTCCAFYSLGGFKTFLEKQIPNVYVTSLRFGNNTIEDRESGFFMNPNDQIDYACKVLAADPNLQKGFNVIGFSQGCQFLRGMIQRCGHKLPPVKSFISLGGQHQGVYGLPHCMAVSHKTCDYIRELLNYAAYQSWLQSSLVQATYWHDPLNEEEYMRKSIYLADINNELAINETYRSNLKKLENFVMVKFDSDSMVQPRESEWFGFYTPGQGSQLQTLQQSRIYTEDRLGLQAMDRAGKLAFLSQPGDHLQFDETWFIDNIINKYLV
ncbi:palmitoyl-protein thioesterase 1-like [Cydia amplana]|uniref:palmitoyl-protein thioesterase 1-like n=1 Tax=Cydia amplana TaxID=1869771 RepID=UPI002FE5D202